MAPQDIGPLIAEIKRDIQEECGAEIRALLFRWAWPHIERQATRGFPEWYKRRLAGIQEQPEAVANAETA